MKCLRHLTLVIALLIAAPAFSKTLTIGIDVSTSNPLVTAPSYARVAAQYARDQVRALQPGDIVQVRTFGDRGLVHFPSERIRLSRQNSADKVADSIARFIAGLPSRPLQGQGSTNIIAFLEFGQFDCANDGRVLLLTDGIESSSYIDDANLLAGKAMPPPEKNLLSGCEVTMLGFGQSPDGALPPQAIKNARASWAAWMKTADATFNPIIDP